MNRNENFLKIFYELLDEKGLNKRQFAEKSGIPYPTVIGWTNQGRLPDFSALGKIADCFGCTVDYLLGREDDGLDIPFDVEDYKADSQKMPKKWIDADGLTIDDYFLVERLVERLKKG